VVVSATSGSLDLTRMELSKAADRRSSISSTLRVPGWTAKAGWFVFLETEQRVWAYDGDRQLCLNTQTSVDGAFYPGPSGFPCAVPAQVLARLSEPAKRALETP
jgi:hypothetical protein